MDPKTLDVLTAYSWPGNVRELENIISRAVLKAKPGADHRGQIIILPEHLGADLVSNSVEVVSYDLIQSVGERESGQNSSLREATVAFQKTYIRKVLQANNQNWAAAARELNMHRSNLHNLAKRIGLRH